MPTLLRLDPGHPALWRTERVLQFGVDAVVTVVDPEPWQERLVHELERGLHLSALPRLASRYGVAPAEASAFVDRLQPAVTRRSPEADPRVELDADSDDPCVAALEDALVLGGVVAVAPSPAAAAPAANPPTRILIAHNALDPARARAAMRDDVPHLPIVFRSTRASVGPLVLPGRTACLACLDAHRLDADPAWPALIGQLLGRPATAVSGSLASEAGVIASWLVRGGAADPEGRRAVSVTLVETSPRRSWRTHRPHERCACRSP